MNMTEWREGLRDGMPIAAGYFAVSFGLGIAAQIAGLSTLAAGAMSALNMTSAGEFAAIGIIASGGGIGIAALSTLVINLRYALMSAAISQRLDPSTSTAVRLALAFCMTDEIFALSAMRRGRLCPWYTWGVMSAAWPGWTFGTVAGAAAGSILPDRIVAALSVAIYGMFIAIIVPPSVKHKNVAAIVILSMVASLAFDITPALSGISGGTKIVILTIAISSAAAVLLPDTEDR